MAGVKGRSGGPRKNSGGTRPGAGRPRKNVVDAPPVEKKEPAPAVSPVAPVGDAKEFLERVVRGEVIANAQQLDAAKALLPYQHRKLGEGGKKEKQQEEAGKVAGRFSPAAPPRLVAADGKRV